MSNFETKDYYNWYIKPNLTTEEMEQYALKDFVVGYLGKEYNSGLDINTNVANAVSSGDMFGAYVEFAGNDFEDPQFFASCNKALYRFKWFSHRKIGYVFGQNDDGSPQVAILGSDTFRVHDDENQSHPENQRTNRIFRNYVAKGRGRTEGSGASKKAEFGMTPIFVASDTSPGVGETVVYASKAGNSDYQTLDEIFDMSVSWIEHGAPGSILPDFFGSCCYQGSAPFGYDQGYAERTLTDDVATTVIFGLGLTSHYFTPDIDVPNDDTLNTMGAEAYDSFVGDMFEATDDFATMMASRAQFWAKNLINAYHNAHDPHYADYQAHPIGYTREEGYSVYGGRYAFNWKPYNLILTEDLNQAHEYIRTGRIPSDAWMYPWDPDEFPSPPSWVIPDDTGGDDGDGTEDDPGSDGDPITDIVDQPTETPATSTQELNPNNLYWLQKGQFHSFMDWFWLDAGTILDAGDLWDKVRGLYNDLASCIVNVRYMPINPEWIGGTSSTNAIIIGQIEKPMTGGVQTINRTTPAVRTLGEYDLKNVANCYIDESPHSEVSLYLPFYGYMSLDNDFLRNVVSIKDYKTVIRDISLVVKCLYDIMSGTVQYFVYAKNKKSGDSALINTVLAKMATDIPITLQSKNDRDSAIFGNIMNATGSMIGAGVSMATKNPIGMALAIGNVVQGGSQSAQLSVKGSVGEMGATFAPSRCAITVKQTRFKRPKAYNKFVGYTCYDSIELAKLKNGVYITVPYPYIEFKGNHYNSNGINTYNYPTDSEIEEIYEALKGGVRI